MYARVIDVKVSPNKVDEAIRLFRSSVVPAAKQQQGFRSIRLLVERNMGKLQSTSLWETEADLRATEEGSTYLQEQLAKFISGTDVTEIIESINLQEQFSRFISLYIAPPVVTHYEVAVEE
jgi:heme-degrading monooxygenase HmoA